MITSTVLSLVSVKLLINHDISDGFQEAYFPHRAAVIREKNDKHLVLRERDINDRLDIEATCEETLNILGMTDDSVIDHKYTTPGYSEGFIMADGIEKVSITFIVFSSCEVTHVLKL